MNIKKGKRTMDKVRITTDIDADDMVFDISRSLSSEDVVKFITVLEKTYADLGVTEKLYRYFKEQKQLFESELKDDEEYKDWDEE